VGEDWYAGMRLACSTVGVHVWAQGVDNFYTYLSRCMEKTALYPLTVLDDILKDEQYKDYKHIEMWADGASNFKNSIFLGTCGFQYLERHKWKSFSAQFGAPKHFKSVIDTHFAHLAHIKKSYCLKEFLLDIPDLVKAYEQAFDQIYNIHGGTKHIVNNFQPPEKAELPFYKFTCESCMGIQGSFSFLVTRNDDRRKSLRGRAPYLDLLTGLTMKSFGMTRGPSAQAKTGTPMLEDFDIKTVSLEEGHVEET